MNTPRPMRLPALTLAIAASVLLMACGPQDGSSASGQPAGDRPASTRTAADRPAATPATPAPPAAAQRPPQAQTGTVTAVVPLHAAEPATGAGAVIGGLVGGALGSTIGKGDGRKAATVIGAVGGAVAGHEVEKQRNTRITGYRVEVRLDDGRLTTTTLADPGGLASGQRVRLVDGRILPA